MADSVKRAYVAGLGTYVPPRVLTNDDFAKIVDTSDEWITQMTGIKERHVADARHRGVGPRRGGGEDRPRARRRAPRRTSRWCSWPPRRRTCSSPRPRASRRRRSGRRTRSAYDITAGCSGFVYGLVVAEQFIAAGTVKTALVIGAEMLTSSRGHDRPEHLRSLRRRRRRGRPQGLRPAARARDVHPRQRRDARGPAQAPGRRLAHAGIARDRGRPHALHQDERPPGVRERREGDERLPRSRCWRRPACPVAELDLLFPHQANIRIMESVAERAGMPMEKVFVNIDRYGNTSAASIPIALDDAVERGVLTEGMLVGMVAFGAGFTWARGAHALVAGGSWIGSPSSSRGRVRSPSAWDATSSSIPRARARSSSARPRRSSSTSPRSRSRGPRTNCGRP